MAITSTQRFTLIAAICLWFVGQYSALAEGTDRVWKNYSGVSQADESGGLIVNFLADPVNGHYPSYNFNSDTLNRLYVHVDDHTSEEIYFGFNVRRLWFNNCGSGNTNGDYSSTQISNGNIVYWRLRNPSGTTVMSGQIAAWNGGTTASAATGYIGNYTQAVNGPDNVDGVGTAGYTPATYNPTASGDYYFEFNYRSNTTAFDASACTWATIEFQYFDISIVEGTNSTDGRVWSRQWSLSTVNRSPSQGIAVNSSEMHVYTDDSIITLIEFDSIYPGMWNVFANENGVGTSGTFELDARSDVSPASQLNRKNRVFLSTPDTNVYPARELTRTVSPVYIQRCDNGSQCIMVDLNRPSTVNVYIEANDIPGYQLSTADVLITNVAATRGLNCVPWDGNDGLGNPLLGGDTVFIQVLFESDITQLPLQDIESNPNGLEITLELPISGSTAAYWNDTLVGGSVDLLGCISSPGIGCHDWTGDFSSGIGNGNVINTYWYSTLDTLVPIPIVDSTFSINIQQDTLDASCIANDTVDPGTISLTNFSGNVNQNFRWTTTGTGTFEPHDSTLHANYIPSADELQYGGSLKLYINPRVGCPEVVDSLIVDFGKRPGGVESSILTWLKADEGALNIGATAAINGQNAATWFDQTNQGNSATALVTGPVYTDDVINNNPALVFNDNDADRLSLAANFQAPTNGTGTYVAGSSTGITNGTNATGAANGTFAQVYDTGDLLVIDLGQTLSIGQQYTLTWRRKNSYTFGPTADMVVQESTSPGSGYTSNSVVPNTTSITTFITTVMTAQVTTRYIRLSTLTGTNDDFDFDAVSFSFGSESNETVFLVAQTNTSNDNAFISDGDNANRRQVYASAANNPILRLNGAGTTTNATPIIANGTPFVSSVLANASANERWFVNGLSQYNAEFGSLGTTTELLIGNNSALSGELAGAVAEVIVYEEALSTTEREQVETYLAIKYGLSLSHHYLDSDGSILFESDGSGGAYTFDNDIGGIGQNICKMTLSQPKSMSVNADRVVQMGDPSSLDDFDYHVWGNDNGALSVEDFVDVNSYYFTHRVERIWRIDTSGNIGTVTVAFYLGNIPAVSSTDANSYGLVISGNSSLANGFIGNYARAISNDTLYFYGVTFGDDEYFTLATALTDTDNDGIADVYDIDDDNDAIPDTIEFFGGTEPLNDTDRDGIPDYADNDFPGCGGLVLGVCSNADADGDGIPNHFDLDADNDGIPDLVEGGGVDTDGDGVIDVEADADDDGLFDLYDPTTGGDAILVLNTDGDALPDYLDLDADDDGIPDVVEAGGTDTDGDGIFDDQTDTDNDGFADDVDGDVGNDGTAENASDAQQITGSDTDSDGVPNTFPNDDTDGDGIRDQLDLDADDDGIPDVVEAGGTDTDGDGLADNYSDADNDGFNDVVDGDVGNDGTAENTSDALQLTGPDTDNNGAPNSYPDDDTDSDGIRDQLDLDADDDGIPDVVEAGGTDTDGDGLADNYSDTDTDGFNDVVDGDVGNDGTAENTADALQLTGTDTDSDGTPNSYPDDDTDGDGIRDQLDLDADDDGIPDVVEAGGTDTDGDGLADNYADTDTDGFNDVVDGDVGNDGTAENTGDALQVTGADTDIDGTPNSYPNDDTDGDGIRDQLDLDADDDGIPDVVEAGGTDTDGDGLADNYADTDTDGFNDVVDGDVGNDGTAENTADAQQLTGADTDNDGTPNSYPEDDTDGDGIRDQLDLDADDDGIPDVVEAGGTDTDGDGLADNYSDTDTDGFNDLVDGDVGNDGTAENTSDALQITGSDTDNDGVPNSVVSDDLDDDGRPSQLDLDSDGDGITDVTEGFGDDTDEDGLSDSYLDSDGDGFNDNVDGDVGNDGTAENSANALILTGPDGDSDGAPNSYVTGDSDGDGLIDELDIDADNDGIVDNTEAQPTAAYLAPSGTDTDDDGLDNAYDPDNGGTYQVPENTDSADLPDYLDLDTDNDGKLDEREGHDSDGNGQADAGSPSATGFSGGSTDSDNDGLLDGWDNNTASTDPTNNGLNPTSHPDADNPGTDRDWREIDDNDRDGITDAIDIDDDNDGIPDVDEANGNDPDGDEDGDGILNWIDTSDDGNGGDGSVTSYADGNADGMPDVYELDNDGVPNHLDKDCDNDGITDILEALGTDVNEDGEVDYPTAGVASTMLDADNDGLDDNRDDVDSGSGGGEVTTGTPWAEPNTDGNTEEDYQDIDADDDGIIDNIEAQVSSAGQLMPVGSDSDNDGIDDTFDTDNGGTYIYPVNTDNTGNGDYADTDADDDGEVDLIEGWDIDGDGNPETLPSGSDNDSDGLDDAFDQFMTVNQTTNPTNNGEVAFDFPNADVGTIERDWREVVCAGGTVILAVNDSITNASDYCINSPWTYYFNPIDPTQLLFAIEHEPAGGNTNAFTVSIDLTVSVDPETESGVFSEEDLLNEQATFVMGRYWNIGLSSGSLNGPVNIRFYYDQAEADTLEAVAERWNDQNAGGTAFVSGLRWFSVNTGTFDHNSADLQAPGILNSTQLFPAAAGSEDGVLFAQFDGITSFTGGGLAYTIGNNSVILPIELIGFEADEHSATATLLTWATASESNSERFDVQRQTADGTWETIWNEPAAGFSNHWLNYRHVDEHGKEGTLNYRLLLVDADGHVDSTTIESVHFGIHLSSGAVVFPNPTADDVYVLQTEAVVTATFALTDASGRIITEGEFKPEQLASGAHLDLPLAQGVYNLTLVTNNQVEVYRISVVR